MSKPKSRPFFDDMGNFIGLKDRPLIEMDGDHVKTVHKAINPNRLMETNAGCFNCLHWDTGLGFDAKLESCFKADYAADIAKGISSELATKRATLNRNKNRASRGYIGTCAVNAAVDEKRNHVCAYTPGRFMCGDPATGQLSRWTAKVGASLSRLPGEGLTAPIGEIYDKIGETAPILQKQDDPPPADEFADEGSAEKDGQPS